MKKISLTNLSSWLNQPVEPYILSFFRIVYGLFMASVMIRYMKIDLVRNMFVLPKVNFHYDYLRWLKPLPEQYMNLLVGILLVCALAIAAGLFFKWACRIFALGYAYIFLIDKSIYNNHIYLFILLAILLSFTNADRFYSFRKKGAHQDWIPRWQILTLQVQVVIVYFYGGIAKLTRDWILNCQPVKTLLDIMPADHLLAPLIKNEAGVYILNYGGLFIDLGAPLLLWYKPLRKWGVVLFIVFNTMNSRIFTDIGIFPYVMLASLVLFFNLSEIPILKKLVPNHLSSSGKKLQVEKARTFTFPLHRGTIIFLSGYFCFQFLFPFRGHFLPNPLDWTTIGNRFSWRMKVDTRETKEMKFFIHSPQYNEPVPVEIQTFINDMQILNLSMDPRSVADFAGFLKSEAIKYNTKDPAVKANIQLRYNGRPVQYFIRPEVDLAEVSYSPFKKLNWVVPVTNEQEEDDK